MTDEAFGLDELENASKRKLKETFSKVFSRPKEELWKEAVTRVDAFIDNFSQDVRSTLYDRLSQEDVKDFLYGLYVDSAEPREKQIDELKAQIKVLGQNLEDTEICENDLKNRIAELEEISTRLESYYQNQKVRIAELEAQIEKMKFLLNEIYSEFGFSELVKIRNDLPLEMQEVIKEVTKNGRN